jgi:hypothetical protein
MAWLGMCALGIFVGYVAIYGLKRVKNWEKPANIYSAIFTAVTGGGIFIFIEYLSLDNKKAVLLYPVGLIYGTLCANMEWIAQPQLTAAQRRTKNYLIAAFVVATILLLAIFLSSWFRSLLETIQ